MFDRGRLEYIAELNKKKEATPDINSHTKLKNYCTLST